MRSSSIVPTRSTGYAQVPILRAITATLEITYTRLRRPEPDRRAHRRRGGGPVPFASICTTSRTPRSSRAGSVRVMTHRAITDLRKRYATSSGARHQLLRRAG